MRFLLLCMLLLPVLTLATEETGSEVEIQEWQVPWEKSRPRDPYVDQRQRVWFCGQAGNYVAYLEPATGTFRRYQLEPGTYPHNLIVDKAGYVWYAGNRNAHIGRLNPDDGSITRFPMPDPRAQDPHTLVFSRDGNIWFSVQWGNFVGHLETATGRVRLIEVTTRNARPYGIKRDSRDRPWLVLLGTHKLATVDPQTLTLKEIELPRREARPRRLEISSDDNIWYVDYAGGFLGRYDPDTRQFQEWPLPGGAGARPYGTARDIRDRIWIAETGANPNRLVGFDPRAGRFFSSTEIPSGGGTIRHMYYHLASNEIWFGTDTNYIGRARLPR